MHKRVSISAISAFAVVCGFSFSLVSAKDLPTSRRDGFLLIWNSIARPVSATSEKPYVDLRKNDKVYSEITYAKARGLLDEHERKVIKGKAQEVEIEITRFRPDDALLKETALLWLFRTRSLEPLNDDGSTRLSALVERPDILALAKKHGIATSGMMDSLSNAQLLSLMRSLDASLESEQHEVSLYAEKFHGKGTAFGESFDMHALTAAHRTFPANTLVEVMNVENGKRVTVRINDRGPYVSGRDLDLSLAAFTLIADRAKGKIQATFRRLGDAGILSRCNNTRMQRRIGKTVVLKPGIPHFFPLGNTLSLSASDFFFVASVTYPDGNVLEVQNWIGPSGEEEFAFTPSVSGNYSFVLKNVRGRTKNMAVEVVSCS